MLSKNTRKQSASHPGRFMSGIEHAYAVIRRLCRSQRLSGSFSFVFVQKHTAGPLCFSCTVHSQYENAVSRKRLCESCSESLIVLGKAVPLQAWSGPEGSRKLRFPDFMTTAQEGGKVVSLTHRPHLPPGNYPGTHFC